VLFEEASTSSRKEQLIPSIEQAILHLTAQDKQELTRYFEQLSQNPSNEPLRVAFLDTLQGKCPQSFLEHLLHIPNPAGLRISYVRHQEELDASIKKITSRTPTQVKIIRTVRLEGKLSVFESYLKEDIIATITTPDGNIQQQHPGSAHCVAFAQGLYFKQKPTHPLMEFAIHNLFSRLAGSLTPPSELVRFDIQLTGKTLSYPVLISQGIPGPTLKTLERDPSLQTLDITRLTWFLLGSLLTRPGDGRLSNYVVKDNLLFCIDNDLSFVEPVTQYRFSKEINFCSALFCLPEQPLSSEVFNQFIHLDRTALLDGWIEDVIAREKQYISLFTPEETERLWSEDPNNRFIPTILFKEGTLVTLDVQFGQLQAYLQQQLERGAPITPQDLLKQLINLQDTVQSSVGPIVAKAYSQPADTLGKRLAKAVGRHQEASLTSAQFLEKTFKKIPSTEEVHKKKVFSPEKAREELLHSLLQNPQIGVMQDRENHLSLRGDFTCLVTHGGPDTVRQTFVLKALQFLAKKKQHTSIVLRSCAVLDYYSLQPFLQDTIEHLDISYSPNIHPFDISQIRKRCPRLKRLHLEGCDQLKNIDMGLFQSLEELSIRNCSNLISLRIQAPRLRSLSAQNTTSLSNLTLDVQSFPLIDLKKSPCTDLKINPLENICREPLDFENVYHFYMHQLTQIEAYSPVNERQCDIALDRLKGICENLKSSRHSIKYQEHVLEKIERLYFGINKWQRYFGVELVAPYLPPDIREILQGPCPIFPGKKVAETHFLTLIPEGMSLEQLESLTQNPKEGNKIGFRCKDVTTWWEQKDDTTWEQHAKTSSGKAHWVLMTNDVIPDSRYKTWKDQQTLAATFKGQGYELLSGIDAATCLLTEYVQTGRRFYTDSPWTWTRCVEQVKSGSSQRPLAIGGFAPDGVTVTYDGMFGVDYVINGVGVARKFF
jgi:hypothetical protein